MDYRRIYDQLIIRARYRVLDGYAERHHVIPKCLGGADDLENLVRLTPEEHFLAHVLLVKIHPEEPNLILAVQKMTVSSRGHRGRRSRNLYGWLRRRFVARMSQLQTGEGNSQFGSRWINDGNSSKKIENGVPLPEGWRAGRIVKKASYDAKKAQEARVLQKELYTIEVRAIANRSNDDVQRTGRGYRIKLPDSVLIDALVRLFASTAT